MNDRDVLLIKQIHKHFDDIQNELKIINDSFDEFLSNFIVQKAIQMDLLQIGENINSLSQEKKNKINKIDLRGIVQIRNYIAHGYIKLDNWIIWDSIHKDLPRLITAIE